MFESDREADETFADTKLGVNVPSNVQTYRPM